MSLLVQKFGGTSVADPDRIRAVAEHIVRTRRAGDDVVVVVSAMGKTTDDLERLAHDVVQRARPPARWTCCSPSGERISIALLCMAIIDRGEPAVSFTGSQAGIVTDTAHRKAKILEIRADRLREALDGGQRRGRRRLPGRVDRRATSPRSAGAAPTPPRSRSRPRSAPTSARSTPTSPGVYTADPRIVPDARRLDAALVRRDARDVGHGRARARAAIGRVRAQLRRAGARAVELHLGAGHVGAARRSRTWNSRSSRVSPTTSPRRRSRSSACPTGPGIAATVFRALADETVNVDMIEQNVSTDGHTDISFTVPRGRARAHDRRSSTRWSVEIEAGGVNYDDGDRPGLAGRRGHEDAIPASRRRCSRRWPPRASTSR